jgi:hypothetical protein
MNPYLLWNLVVYAFAVMGFGASILITLLVL